MADPDPKTGNPLRTGAKTPENVRLWSEIMIYVSLDVDSASDPTDIDDDFSGDWIAAGMMDPAGVDNDDESDDEPLYDFGGDVARTREGVRTVERKFTMFEDNEISHALRYGRIDGETDKYGPAGVLKVRYAEEYYDEGSDYAERYIAAGYVELRRDGTYSTPNDDIAKYPVIARVFPDKSSGKPIYWEHQYRGQDDDGGDEGTG